MSRDIRSFFSVQNSKKAPTPKPSNNVSDSPVLKRKAVELSSGDEDRVAGTPKVKKPKTKEKTRRRNKKSLIIESDESGDEKKTSLPISPFAPVAKKLNLTKLKSETIAKPKSETIVKPKSETIVKPKSETITKPKSEELLSKFGEVPKRIEKKKYPKQKTEEEKLLDDDFDQSIIDLDEVELIEEVNGRKETVLKKSPEIKLNGNKSPARSPAKKIIEEKSPAKFENIASTSKDLSKFENKNDGKKLNISITKDKTPNERLRKKVDLDSSAVLSDEERHERKRAAAILYQKYKNRQGALNPGSKEIPKGKPNCLAGLTFVVTGVLESMERDEACAVIKELGGKISSTVGKRLNYMVVGEDAGPKKLATAEELGIKILSEDQLLDLIREKSGEKLKDSKSNDKASSRIQVEKTPNKEKKSSKSPSEKSEKKTPIKIEENNKSETSPVEKKNIEIKKNSKTPEKRKIDDESVQPVVKKEKKAEKKETTTKKKDMEDVVKSDTLSGGEESLQWVDKYKPTNVKQIIGQQGASSNCVKLRNWLSKWYINHDGKKKLPKPNPWAKNDDGSYYKAALLSGPPGVGKTTTATLVCKELGFDIVEFNASDTRSKKLLKEEVSELLSCKSLYGYFHGSSDAVSKKHVLIMDEVDGMAGNEDRGGIQELIALIKDSNVPIICMCNDRNHQKMRSLVNYCYDLRFNRPRLEQIKGPIMSICFKEQIKLPPSKIEEIISATNHDIRQTLHHLSILSAGKELNLLDKSAEEKTAQKDMKLGPWDVVRKVFSIDEHKNMSFYDKCDLFFHDYSLGPLFVQQNYLQVLPKVPTKQIPEQVALAADSLSLGDLVDKRIRSNSAWALLPTQAVFSSVMPGEYMEGHFVGQINFPGWLGKYSKANKRKRLAQEIHDHTRVRTSGSRLSIRLDYAPFLLDAICRPLKTKGLDGVEESLKIIKEYHLLREDIESLIELCNWPNKKNPMDSVDGRVKAALTRAYNKEVLAYTYSAQAGVKKKRAEAADDLELEGNEEAQIISEDEENDDKIENDALIKAKKKTATKAVSEKTTTKKKASDEKKAGTSKAAGTSKGAGPSKGASKSSKSKKQ